MPAKALHNDLSVDDKLAGHPGQAPDKPKNREYGRNQNKTNRCRCAGVYRSLCRYGAEAAGWFRAAEADAGGQRL